MGDETLKVKEEDLLAIASIARRSLDPDGVLDDDVFVGKMFKALRTEFLFTVTVPERTSGPSVPEPKPGTRIAVVTSGNKVPLGVSGVVFWTGTNKFGPCVGFNTIRTADDGPDIGETVFVSAQNVTMRDPRTDEHAAIRDVNALGLIEWASKKAGGPENLRTQPKLVNWLHRQYDEMGLEPAHIARKKLDRILTLGTSAVSEKRSKWRDLD